MVRFALVLHSWRSSFHSLGLSAAHVSFILEISIVLWSRIVYHSPHPRALGDLFVTLGTATQHLEDKDEDWT